MEAFGSFIHIPQRIKLNRLSNSYCFEVVKAIEHNEMGASNCSWNDLAATEEKLCIQIVLELQPLIQRSLKITLKVVLKKWEFHTVPVVIAVAVLPWSRNQNLGTWKFTNTYDCRGSSTDPICPSLPFLPF